MVIKSFDWSSSLAEDIRQEGEAAKHNWVIAINPHGNMGSTDDATATISWDPSQFGEGDYELLKGWDGTGEVVVPDMKTVTKFDVTGGNGEQYFLLVFTLSHFISGDIDHSGSIDMTDIILALQTVGGITQSVVAYKGSDINADQKIGIEEAIYVLQVVAGLRLQNN